MEGVEPSSKRGIIMFSTCLVIDLVFERTQARDYQCSPYSLNLSRTAGKCPAGFRIS